MDGAAIDTTGAPRPVELRVTRLEDRVTCLENQGARVEERTTSILALLQRIEERVYQTHGDVRSHGGVQGEDRRSRGELLKTITLVFTALAALIAAVAAVSGCS